MTDALINKYRPDSFQQVVGQETLIKALKQAVKDKSTHAFLFTGPSGCGKTTLARIVARELGCDRPREIDGPTYSGIENMRGVCESLRYKPLGEGDVRAIIIDECHQVSKQAFQAVLKSLEEPPEWVYWFLCTTEPQRIPKTIITRCMQCEVRSVATSELCEFLNSIADNEKMKVSEDIADLCAREADGSPRQAISNLALCAAITDRKEAISLLKTAHESSEAIELARALVKGTGWSRIRDLLANLSETNPESVRHVVRAYTTTAILGQKSDQPSMTGFQILDAFSEPFNPNDGISPLVLAVGKVMFP